MAVFDKDNWWQLFDELLLDEYKKSIEYTNSNNATEYIVYSYINSYNDIYIKITLYIYLSLTAKHIFSSHLRKGQYQKEQMPLILFRWCLYTV